MTRYLKAYLFPFLMLAYILGNAYIMVYKKGYFYPYNLLPVAFFIIYTAVFHLQNLVFFLAFFTPLAVSLKELGLTEGPDLSLPTEPVMFGVMLVYLLNYLHRDIADKKFFRHPISILIFLQLFWMLFTTFTSTELVISIKYFISRLWFMFSCYFIMQHLFSRRASLINFIFAYSAALAIVVCYTTISHARFNFDEKIADWIVSPFYNDHTAYGAALAMFIPVMVSFWFLKSLSRNLKILSVVFFAMFMLAIILSFARAGWGSLAVALCVYITLLLGIRFRTLLITFTVLITTFLVFQTEIMMILSKNDQDAKGGFENNIVSMVNISTEASNLERLNRWSCAIRMWEDKPVLGWGPGTYMFKYAPYQLSRELTIISTNFGTNGNAHSEYLGPLAEQGVIGLLIVIVILFYVTSFGYRLVYSLANKDDKILCTGIFLGIMTYFVHGFINNFLDTDKLSLPFWGFLAAMVCFDLYYPKKQKI